MKKIMRTGILAAYIFGALPGANATSVYAPYLDMTAWPTPIIDQIGVQQGIQQFNLAFVVAGNGCVPSWGGVQNIGPGNSSDLLTSIAGSITNYRAQGGEVAISFGGENGQPLAQACTSVSALAAAYQTVISTYSLSHIDFDIEGSSIEDTASITRNFQAVAQIQQAMAAAGSTLHVTLTLPVMPTGLTQDGLNVVSSAISNQVAFDSVNGMTMDYGGSVADMGAAALQAATSVYQQLDTIYKGLGQSKTDAQLWQLVGVTPMIGVNDTQGETFTLDNAQNMANVASNDGFGLIGIWSTGRDQACPSGPGGSASPSCSGIAQTPFAFSAIFNKALPASWGKGVTQNPAYGGTPGGPTSGAAWSATQIYTAGNTVTYQGATYQAQWWTQGDIPGQAAVWKQISGPVASWSSSSTYNSGACVTYQGAEYCAQWWTQGNVPTAGAPWVKSS